MARLRHFLIQGTARPQPYVSTQSGGGSFKSPPRDDRAAHGDRLADNLRQAAEQAVQHPEPPAQGLNFVPIAVTGDPVIKLLLTSLDNKTLGLQLVNSKTEPGGVRKAILHIPKDRVPAFAQKFEAYAHDTNKRKKPPNQHLAESISEFRLAMLRDGDYWTDSGDPPTHDEEFWWEI
jgi:hypothetical protein